MRQQGFTRYFAMIREFLGEFFDSRTFRAVEEMKRLNGGNSRLLTCLSAKPQSDCLQFPVTYQKQRKHSVT
jgi:hypothetical protein